MLAMRCEKQHYAMRCEKQHYKRDAMREATLQTSAKNALQTSAKNAKYVFRNLYVFFLSGKAKAFLGLGGG